MPTRNAYTVVWSNPWVRAGVGIGIAAAICVVLYLLSPILVALFFAFIIAYIFDPVVDIFERRKIPRMVTILTLVFLMLVGMAAVPLLMVPSILQEADQLVQASGDLEKETWVKRVEARLPLDKLVEALGWQEFGNDQDMSPIETLVTGGAHWIRENAGNFLRSYASQLMGASSSAGRSIAEFVKTSGDWLMRVGLFLGNFVLFLFVSIYLLKDYDRIVAAGHDLIPPRFRDKITSIMRQIDNQLKAFLRGQVMVMFALGLMYSIGFSLSGLLFAVPLGIFGGLASFVPYLGAALTIIPAVVLTLIVHGVDWHLLAVLATIGIAQFLEGNVLTPKIVGSQVGLGPVWVILAVLVFSSWLGFLGLLLAVPIAAALKVLVMEGLALYRASGFFQGTVEDSSVSPVATSEDSTSPESPSTRKSSRSRSLTGKSSPKASAKRRSPRRKSE